MFFDRLLLLMLLLSRLLLRLLVCHLVEAGKWEFLSFIMIIQLKEIEKESIKLERFYAI